MAREVHEKRHWSDVPQLYLTILDHFMRGNGTKGQKLELHGLNYKLATNTRQQIYRWFEKLRGLQRQIQIESGDHITEERHFRALFTSRAEDWRVRPGACNKIMITFEPHDARGEAPVRVVFTRRPEYAIDESFEMERAPAHVLTIGKPVEPPPPLEPAPKPVEPVELKVIEGTPENQEHSELDPSQLAGMSVDQMAAFIKNRAKNPPGRGRKK